MHLHDLLEKKNRNLVVSKGVIPFRQTVDGDVLLGLKLPPTRLSTIVLNRASDHPHLAGMEDAGFFVTLLGRSFFKRPSTEINVSFVRDADRVTRTTTVVQGMYSRLLLPSMLDMPDPFEVADLVIEAAGPPGEVFIGSSGWTPRDALYRLAKGVGVEIGPGPKPQIKNGPDTQVTYVDEMPVETWLSLYNANVSREAWSLPGYKIGKAHDLPIEDGSLDFIFSSHVLEHLYNPLGHFDHWRRKLKPGGLILGVVPLADGTKDFVFPPTSIIDLIQEQQEGAFTVPLKAYEHWVRHHQPHHKDMQAVASKYYKDKFSIHVHVYDYVTINNLLRRCVAAGGYSAYRLLFKRNSKDFAFALKAGQSS
jgi:SAM-dependent methyltransferase